MKMKRILPITAVLVLGALLLLQPETASQAVRGALTLCFRTVVPSLFPFFVVVSLLLQLGLADFLQGLCAPLMGPLFRLRGVCALPVLTGLLGGYPSGAKTAADLYAAGELTRQEAELLLGFCDNCGPAFLVGYVGASVLGSPQAGARLFLIHIAAALQDHCRYWHFAGIEGAPLASEVGHFCGYFRAVFLFHRAQARKSGIQPFLNGCVMLHGNEMYEMLLLHALGSKLRPLTCRFQVAAGKEGI